MLLRVLSLLQAILNAHPPSLETFSRTLDLRSQCGDAPIDVLNTSTGGVKQLLATSDFFDNQHLPILGFQCLSQSLATKVVL